MSTAQEIAADVKALRESFNSGLTRDLDARLTQLRSLQLMLKEGLDEIKAALWKDMHKNPIETRIAEMALLDIEVQLHLDYMKDWAKPEKVGTDLTNLPGSSYIYREPLGVVCVIGTWNYPLLLSITPLIGALSAGNTVMLRIPGEDTSVHTNAVLLKLLAKYVDRRFLRVVHGGVDATKSMLEQKFDLILCTGGTFIGKIVAEAAAKTLTPTILELGGKSPVVIEDSTNLEVAAKRITWGSFNNCGQTCVRPDYVLVNAKVGDKFVQLLEKNLVEFFGQDAQQSDSFGRIVNSRSFERVSGMLTQDAKRITFGGDVDAKDRYIAPTLLNFKRDFEAFDSSAVMAQEIFGPILPIYYYEDLDEAISYIRAHHKPLALYVFTTNGKNRDRVLAETSSGSVCVNDVVVQLANPSLPFGGVGNSGMGAYTGKASFDAFSHKKSVMLKYTMLDVKERYQPYTKSGEKLLMTAMKPITRRMVTTFKLSAFAVLFAVVGVLVKFTLARTSA